MSVSVDEGAARATQSAAQSAAQSNAQAHAHDLRRRHAALLQRSPQLRARDAAAELGVAEGELLAARIGEDAVRLVEDAPAILQSAQALGKVMALTRNEHCVHERKGVYANMEFFSHGRMTMGLVLNPDIDLRLFMAHWAHALALTETTAKGARRSLQFFDRSGHALHKIYLTEDSDVAAYDALLKRHAHAEQTPRLAAQAAAAPAADLPDAEIDWAQLRTAWAGLKDTHDFHPMLRRFRVGREQALRKIGEDFAYRVGADALRQLLEHVRDEGCELMVFVGNHGCIQIHTGAIKQLKPLRDWFNVLDPMFNLHVRESAIGGSWVVKKPTADGIVTALEIFDRDSRLMVSFFGKRKPGIAELPLWREIVRRLAPQEGAHVS